MAVFKSTFAGGKPKYGKKAGAARQPVTGIHMHDISVEIPTSAMQGTAGTSATSDDSVLLYKFPAEHDCFLLVDGMWANSTTTTTGTQNNFRVIVDDLDGGASLSWNMGIGDSDGVIDQGIITSSTVGQAAGTAYATNSTVVAAPYLDVTNKYLIWKPTTAGTPATAAEGGIRVKFRAAYGVKPEVDSSLV